MIPYNNIAYPQNGSVLNVFLHSNSSSVEVTDDIDFKQTTYYAQYKGCVKVHHEDGQSQEYAVQWKAWTRPERIDFIIKPKRGKERHYNVMPKGYSEIYLKDDRTAVRLQYSKAEHWSIILDHNSRYQLLGNETEFALSHQMDQFPILYLSYIYADQLH